MEEFATVGGVPRKSLMRGLQELKTRHIGALRLLARFEVILIVTHEDFL